ncbi:hypothetical protein [Bradyrhizobium symbiodeficiens]|uniref:hypothetical protein n=1 Tax=Bradyrhizobium symbiodeficiens TaxID=1404367 RepID=UPI00140F8DDE|nr:hypothetical protein [Bradyrhizobium symbiodeficiens]QIP03968.1 hypothetical protein HAU86_31095 [Bradyrhizobium symbiodeficiens]
MTGLTDKDMAVIFKKDAGDYMIAAENLRTDENSILLVAPTNFMRSHAIELLLKAALLANGWTAEQCRKKLGHKLIEAMNEGEAVGLVLTDQTKSVIRTLSPLHEDYTFRYRPDKPYAFPNQTVATEAVAELFDRVQTIVKANCLTP